MSNNNIDQLEYLQTKAEQFFIQGNYSNAISLYEQLIILQPENKNYYWYLGLSWLLDGEEINAQITWSMAVSNCQLEDLNLLTNQLVEILENEIVKSRENVEEIKIEWSIRQQIRELRPNNINNLLHLIQLSILENTYTLKFLEETKILVYLKEENNIKSLNENLLLEVLKDVLAELPFDDLSYQLIETSLPYIQKSGLSLISILIPFIYKIVYLGKQYNLGILYTKLALKLKPNHPQLLHFLSTFYQDIREYDQGIEVAKLYCSVVQTLADKISANFILMRAFVSAGGYWKEFSLALEEHELMLKKLLEEKPTSLKNITTMRLFATVFFFPYFRDQPEKDTLLRSEVSKLAQMNVANYAQDVISKYSYQNKRVSNFNIHRRLKIGYISYCFRKHSVGWLARWLFEYHDREKFEIFAYMLGAELDQNSLQDWYISKVDRAYKLNIEGIENVSNIYNDEIDILIDLDSLTFTSCCEILAVKPAPIQVTWLGWDASGIPSIDYYIADPYVLPEKAQEYYSEKIWYLPESYIAVNGFEVGVASLRRDQLDIPIDAVVYFTAQRARKYHPDMVRLQLQIIKSIPNSYFLIKGIDDLKSIQKFFLEIADAERISPDRIKFLPISLTEEIHRADMSIADIVLDTYPYNGATTTMETLWLGIPMVTKVGQQFAARNSYTMMINAGITEGIAWTDEEYIEWGVRLGKDENLRRDISWKLQKNRQTAPLWDAKKFTKNMENAYQQMWQIYLDGGKK